MCRSSTAVSSEEYWPSDGWNLSSACQVSVNQG